MELRLGDEAAADARRIENNVCRRGAARSNGGAHKHQLSIMAAALAVAPTSWRARAPPARRPRSLCMRKYRFYKAAVLPHARRAMHLIMPNISATHRLRDAGR